MDVNVTGHEGMTAIQSNYVFEQQANTVRLSQAEVSNILGAENMELIGLAGQEDITLEQIEAKMGAVDGVILDLSKSLDELRNLANGKLGPGPLNFDEESCIRNREGNGELIPLMSTATLPNGSTISFRNDDVIGIQTHFLRALLGGNTSNILSGGISNDLAGMDIYRNYSEDFLSDFTSRYDAIYKQIEAMDIDERGRAALLQGLDGAFKTCMKNGASELTGAMTNTLRVDNWLDLKQSNESMLGRFGEAFIKEYKDNGGNAIKAKQIGLEIIQNYAAKSKYKMGYDSMVDLLKGYNRDIKIASDSKSGDGPIQSNPFGDRFNRA